MYVEIEWTVTLRNATGEDYSQDVYVVVDCFYSEPRFWTISKLAGVSNRGNKFPMTPIYDAAARAQLLQDGDFWEKVEEKKQEELS